MVNYEVIQWVIQTNWNGLATTFQQMITNMQNNIPMSPQEQLYLSQAHYEYQAYKQQMRMQQQMYNQQVRQQQSMARQQVQMCVKEIAKQIELALKEKMKQYIINGVTYVIVEKNTVAEVKREICKILNQFAIRYWSPHNPKLTPDGVTYIDLPKDEPEPDSIKVPCVAYIREQSTEVDIDTPIEFTEELRGAIITVYRDVATINYYVKADTTSLLQMVKEYFSYIYQGYDEMTYNTDIMRVYSEISNSLAMNMQPLQIPVIQNAVNTIISNKFQLKEYKVKYYFNPYSYNIHTNSFGMIFFRDFNVKEETNVLEESIVQPTNVLTSNIEAII